MLDDDLEIRAVDEAGIEEIFGVYKACEDFLALGPAAAASREMVRADLEMSKSMGGKFYGITLRGGPLIGVLDFVPGNFRGQADTAYIALLMLGLSFRRRGIGSRVLALVESEIRKDPQVARIRIGVQVNNPSAIRFWQNRGFRIYAGPELLADQTTVYRLEKAFPPGANREPWVRARIG